jgi:drug/metabolite transporter (DMT)-like permease
MLTVILGFSGAVVLGSADFLGGLASKRLGSMQVTALAAVAGFFTLFLASLWIPGTAEPQGIFWGILSGISGALAFMLLYASLAIGPMSILSPLSALVSAVIPVAWGGIRGDVLGPLGYVAIFIGFVAIVLVGFVPDKKALRPTLRGLLTATGAGLFVGLFIICIEQVNPETGLTPLLANRATSFALITASLGVMAMLHWVRRQRFFGHARAERTDLNVIDIPRRKSTQGHPTSGAERLRIPLLLAFTCGVVDAIGNSLLLFGLHIGDLSVMSVLTAMYPIGTIVLAGIVLRERITPVQLLGLALAIGAAALLALS